MKTRPGRGVAEVWEMFEGENLGERWAGKRVLAARKQAAAIRGYVFWSTGGRRRTTSGGCWLLRGREWRLVVLCRVREVCLATGAQAK